jgi:hypothetical protein
MHLIQRALELTAMTDQDVLRAITTRLSVPLWPEAGMALGYETAAAAYAAAKRGRIPIIEEAGEDRRRKRVPTTWLRRVLVLDKAPAT